MGVESVLTLRKSIVHRGERSSWSSILCKDYPTVQELQKQNMRHNINHATKENKKRKIRYNGQDQKIYSQITGMLTQKVTNILGSENLCKALLPDTNREEYKNKCFFPSIIS